MITDHSPPGNGKPIQRINLGNRSGIAMLEKLGVKVEDLAKEVEVSEEILESYIGKYELMPSFIITITREGNQLKAQATGQPQFEIYPKTDNIFYLKVVQAQVTFNKNADRVVKSLTLLQGGQEIEGKRLD